MDITGNTFDITGYSDSELSLLVFNIEDLYLCRFDSDLRELLESRFIFTAEQWNELQADIQLDRFEQ